MRHDRREVRFLGVIFHWDVDRAVCGLVIGRKGTLRGPCYYLTVERGFTAIKPDSADDLIVVFKIRLRIKLRGVEGVEIRG